MSESLRTEQDRLIAELESLVAGLCDHIVRLEKVADRDFRRLQELELLSRKLQGKLDRLHHDLDHPADC